jgi:hypothetical protein
MSAVPKHVTAMAQLAKEIRAMTAEADRKCRFNRHRMLESELVEYRPDYTEAKELLMSLQVGLGLKMSPDGDSLDPDLEHAFKRLQDELDCADEMHHRNNYDPRDQYTGYEEDFDDK